MSLVSSIAALQQLYWKEFAYEFMNYLPMDILSRIDKSRKKIIKTQWILHIIALLLTALCVLIFHFWTHSDTNINNDTVKDEWFWIFYLAIGLLMWIVSFATLFGAENIIHRNEPYFKYFKYIKTHHAKIILYIKDNKEKEIFEEIRKIIT